MTIFAEPLSAYGQPTEHLDKVKLYLKEPTVIDDSTRRLLEVSRGRKLDTRWACLFKRREEYRNTTLPF